MAGGTPEADRKDRRAIGKNKRRNKDFRRDTRRDSRDINADEGLLREEKADSKE
jgi:hypothetical protein